MGIKNSVLVGLMFGVATVGANFGSLKQFVKNELMQAYALRTSQARPQSFQMVHKKWQNLLKQEEAQFWNGLGLSAPLVWTLKDCLRANQSIVSCPKIAQFRASTTSSLSAVSRSIEIACDLQARYDSDQLVVINSALHGLSPIPPVQAKPLKAIMQRVADFTNLPIYFEKENRFFGAAVAKTHKSQALLLMPQVANLIYPDFSEHILLHEAQHLLNLDGLDREILFKITNYDSLVIDLHTTFIEKRADWLSIFFARQPILVTMLLQGRMQSCLLNSSQAIREFLQLRQDVLTSDCPYSLEQIDWQVENLLALQKS